MNTIIERHSYSKGIPVSTKVGYEDSVDLPVNLLAGAIQYAEKAVGTDHMIPQEQVFRNLYDIMGWEYDSDMV